MPKDNYPVPVLRPKLHRPGVAPDIVPREGQLKRLEAGQKNPLALVSAPAGYGKSTLIANWLEQNDGPSAWLTLDEADSDLRIFLSHLVAALREVRPQSCADLVSEISGQDLPPSRFLARLLANELDEDGARVIVALDDYHRIKGTPVHGFIDSLLEHPPVGLHLVLIARRTPPLATRSLRANGQLTEVRVGDLQLGLNEAATFLEQATGKSISEDAVFRIHRATEGWPAGLRLAALALRGRSGAGELLQQMEGGILHAQRYMIGEVLGEQSPLIQDLLSKTSILDRMCASLCEAVGAEDGNGLLSGAQFLEVLETEGLFIVPLDDRGEWYRYHHLFQDFLRADLEVKATDTQISALHGHAAQWLDRYGSIEEALPHMICGMEPAEIERALVRHCRKMESDEQWHRLGNCLALAPAEVLDQSIELQTIIAFCADKRARYGEMAEALDRAEELFTEPAARERPHDVSRGRVEMMRAAFHAHLGQGGDALERSQRALQLLPDEATADRAYALIMVACGLQMTGNLGKARLLLGKERERHSRASAAFQGQLLQARYLAEWMSADLPSLRRCAAAGLELSDRHDLEETAIWSRVYLGAAQYHLGELEEAETVLDAVATNRHGPSFHLHIISVEVVALIEQIRGRSGRARKLVDSLAGYLLEIGNESYREYLEALQAELDLRQGRHTRAVRWAMDFEAGERWAGYHFSVPELTAAKVLVLDGEDDSVEKAGRMLDELHTFYSASCNNLFLIQTLALQALYFDARGDRDEAVERLGKAIGIARPSGIVRLFVDLGAGLAPLLHRLDLEKEGLEFVGRILSTLGAQAGPEPVVMDGEPAQSADLIEVLTPREFEILSLLELHLSNREIGTRLFISPETVKHHTKNLYGKLGVHSRRDAVAKSRGLGILDGDAASNHGPL